jgi:predicted permease
VIAIIAVIVVALAVGITAERRYHERASDVSRKGLLFVLYVVMPPTTFFNLAAAHIDVAGGVGIGLAWIAVIGGGFAAWFVASRVLRLSRPAIGSVVVCVLIANTGFLGYPVVAVVQGFDALSTAVVYDVLVSSPGLTLGAFSVGAAFGASAGDGPRERVRAYFARNPILYAAILGLLAPESLAPDIAVEISRIAVVAVLPLGFFAVGTALSAESEHGVFAGIPRFDAPVAVAVIGRMVLVPLLLLGLAAPLIDLPETYLLLAAMPCANSVMVVTHAYGLDLRISAAAVAWSTAIAIVCLIPLSLLA